MKKKLLIIMPILIAIIAFVFVYRYYNKEDKNGNKRNGTSIK